jgi:drug/metabolite transporter (DMT)-like permease
MASVVAFVFENPLARVTSMPPEAWFAVIWLGIMGSGLAFLVFFRLIKNWGATRTAMVAYVMPIWGIVLGAVVLGEVIGLDRLSGTALVLAGLALVNVKREAIAGLWAGWRSRGAATEATAEVVTEQR